MRVAIVGGRLQGLEAAYLARKAGWSTILIDRDPSVPAQGLCDHFYCLDVEERESLCSVIASSDLIIPALENRGTLDLLIEASEKVGLPLALDIEAYETSSSKIISNRLFREIGLPVPIPWPDCGFPVIAKPAGSSGSTGVALIRNETEFASFKDKYGSELDGWVIQEYLEGPSFSIEVIGSDGRYNLYQITELEMDELYDCKRVIAPANLSPFLQEQFQKIALKIAQSLKLTGIMDVEVILNQNTLKVLEIDARLPSQTPTAVYHSSGINLLEELASCFVGGFRPGMAANKDKREAGAVVYEHIEVSHDKIQVFGEHIISQAGSLHLCEGFFGAAEALTNFSAGKKNWVATLIVPAGSCDDARRKVDAVIDNIKDKLAIPTYCDPSPEITCLMDYSKAQGGCDDQINIF